MMKNKQLQETSQEMTNKANKLLKDSKQLVKDAEDLLAKTTKANKDFQKRQATKNR